MKKAIISLTVILFFTGLSFAGSKYTIPRFLEYSFTVKNKTNTVIDNAQFLVYAPVKTTSTQFCKQITASIPFETVGDKLGNQVLRFNLKRVPPFGQQIITIKAELLLSIKVLSTSENKKTLKRYINSEQCIESDDARIIKLAETLRVKKPEITAENIFRYTAENIKYAGYIKNDRGALYALEKKEGDCTEYSNLFTALCRANRIPARVVGGYICRENMILKPGEFHNWAQFRITNAWDTADPQNKVFRKNESDYIVMNISGGSNDFKRFKLIGEGLEVVMNE